MAVDRQTVDLSAYPDLVVFYLGIRVRRPRGMLRLLGLEPQIQKSSKCARPHGRAPLGASGSDDELRLKVDTKMRRFALDIT